MDWLVIGVFAFVYLGMILGRIPGLSLDRTGVALLGAIALLAGERVATGELWRAVDLPTLALLFGLMVVSAQFRLGGFYAWLVRRLGDGGLGPAGLLLALILAAGALSALLANDIVCLAVTPVLVELCGRRRLDPRPFLLALACAANLGSAATLIGNPQNMLIGQVMGLSFAGYAARALPPALLGLVVLWLFLVARQRGRWRVALAPPPVPDSAPAFSAWQSAKGIGVLGAVVLAFLLAPWPRELTALAAAGALLLSRHMRSREMLALVDWQLLVLFVGLFVVNHAFNQEGVAAQAVAWLRGAGLDPARPGVLYALSAGLSNLVSNVPAVMLLLPFAHGELAGTALAVSSTLAGNLFLVGSIANLIVVEQAALMGVRIGWGEHARVGVPVTLLTLGLAWLWLAGG